MKKGFIFLSVLLVLSPLFASSQQVTLKNKIENLIRKRSPEAKVYINSASDFLEVDLSPSAPGSDCQIPYMHVTFTYQYNDREDGYENKFRHMVSISCIETEQSYNCIKCGSIYNSGLSTGFRTKQDAYDFIELMSQLKKQSSNR